LLKLVWAKAATSDGDETPLPLPENMHWQEYWLKLQRAEAGLKNQRNAQPPPPNLVRSLRDMEPVIEAAEKKEIPRKLLHTNACGDFTLLSRERWLALRGYPEWEMYSFNVDSFLCYSAHYGGAEEFMIEEPCRFYHIEHESGWTPEQSDRLKQRMEDRGIPWFDWVDCVEWIEHMHMQQAPAMVNGELWGLGSSKLRETMIGTHQSTYGKSALITHDVHK
jgi:hypothetical protein